MLAVFLGTVTVVVLGSLFMDPTYEAESTIMVKMGREHIYQPEVGSASPAVAFDQERILESEIQILTSRDLLRRVIETIGVHKIYPKFDEAQSKIPPVEASILQMQEDLSTTNIKNSNVIRVAYQHHDPSIAATAVNLLIDFLLERHLQIFSNPKADFLEKQVAAHLQKLDVSRSKLQDFKQRYGISSLTEQERLLLQQRQDLDTSLKNVKNDREGLKSKLSSLLQQIPQIPKLISLTSVSERQKVIDEAKSNLLKLRLQKQELSTRYKDTSRFIKNILNEIKMTEAFIKEQEAQLSDRVTKGKNPVYQELEVEIHKSKSEYRSLETRAKEISRHIAEVDEKLAELDSLKKEYETLDRDVETDQNNYAIYLSKVEEARVAQEMDQLKMANISIIQPATIPVKPVKPKLLLNILLGIMIGGAAGVSLAFANEYLQGGYTRPEHLTRDVELPVLTSITYKT
ncbi:MAG: GumC family protein [Nitrospirales bacterium]|nr:GumC family protein [Nitrospirales bacterium]